MYVYEHIGNMIAHVCLWLLIMKWCCKAICEAIRREGVAISSLTSCMVLLKCNFTHARVLVCQHACVNMLPIKCDGVLVSLTYFTRVLHEGLHTRMCYLSGYKLATHMYVLLACTTIRVIHLHIIKNLYM